MNIFDAATLAILFIPENSTEEHIVVTTRALTLRSYPGDAALPGGHRELGESCWQTAEREAREEIGFKGGRRVTVLPLYLSRSLKIVATCIVRSEQRNLSDIAPALNMAEVSDVFSVPLREFLNQPALIQLIPLAGHPWYFYRFEIPGNTAIVGLTAHIILDVARYILGVEPSFEHLKALGFEQGCRQFSQGL